MLKRRYEIKLSPFLGKNILEEKLSPKLKKYSQGIKYKSIPFFGICFSTLLSECSVFGIKQSSSFYNDFQTGNVAERSVWSPGKNPVWIGIYSLLFQLKKI